MPFVPWIALALSVVIEGPEIDPSALAAIVASCDAVVSDHCAAEADADQPPSFRAKLTADRELASVRIELQRGAPDGPILVSRTLSLDPGAPRAERARTIGLVIAAQTRRAESASVSRPASAPASPSAAKSASPSNAAATSTVPGSSTSIRAESDSASAREPGPASEFASAFASAPVPVSYSLDTALSVGSALSSSPRLGALLRASARRGLLGLTSSFRAQARPHSDPRLWWLALSLGVLARFDFPRFALEARLEVLGERFAAWAREPGRTEHTSALRLGPQLGADLFYRLSAVHWLFVGLESAWLAPPVSVRVRGQDRGREQTPSWALIAGFRRTW